MKAFGFEKYGSPSVFEEFNLTQPTPEKGRVIVKTQAFAMNPFDSKLRQGKISFKNAPQLPFVPGSDVAGTVVDAAPDVTEFKIGDSVMGRVVRGAYSEFVSVPHLKLIAKPKELSFVEAAGIPSAGVTAYDVLKGAVHLENVTSILVLGASGAVGSMIVQIAKAMGLFVAATASLKNADFVNQLGADLFISSDQVMQRNFLDHAPVDVLINATPTEFTEKNGYRWLKPEGQLVSLNGFSKEFKVQFETQSITDFNDATYHQNKKALVYLTELIMHNQLHASIAQTFPFSLEGVVQGQTLLDDHHKPGKIVVSKELN